jgi:hypothetical protein
MAFVRDEPEKPKPDKITTLDIEIAIADEFKSCITVPNVSYGMFSHECDIITLSKAGYCSEFEIKVSKSDLKNDFKKKHTHNDGRYGGANKIKYLWYAMPECMKDCVDIIPANAGIMLAYWSWEYTRKYWFLSLKRVREPVKQSTYKFSEQERVKLLELMCWRIWGMKKKFATIKQLTHSKSI